MTSTGEFVVLVHASFAITFAGSEFPVAGDPADAVSPLLLIAVILYEAAGELPGARLRLKPKGSSLHFVVFRFARTGSGLTISVTLTGLPAHPEALTGTTV